MRFRKFNDRLAWVGHGQAHVAELLFQRPDVLAQQGRQTRKIAMDDLLIGFLCGIEVVSGLYVQHTAERKGQKDIGDRPFLEVSGKGSLVDENMHQRGGCKCDAGPFVGGADPTCSKLKENQQPADRHHKEQTDG